VFFEVLFGFLFVPFKIIKNYIGVLFAFHS
jgi:hypothetical protein